MSAIVELQGDADSLINELEDMATELIAAHVEIPDITCPSIDAFLNAIKDIRRDADRYSLSEDRAFAAFARDVELALWGLPDDLEAIREDNSHLRYAVHAMGHICHDAGKALRSFADRIELSPTPHQLGGGR